MNLYRPLAIYEEAPVRAIFKLYPFCMLVMLYGVAMVFYLSYLCCHLTDNRLHAVNADAALSLRLSVFANFCSCRLPTDTPTLLFIRCTDSLPGSLSSFGGLVVCRNYIFLFWLWVGVPLRLKYLCADTDKLYLHCRLPADKVNDFEQSRLSSFITLVILV
jgi:hypothetical protein